MLTINMHNKTGLDYDTVWNAVVRAVKGDKIVSSRNLRLHDHKREEGILSVTACDPRKGRDIILECDLYDITAMIQVASKLVDDFSPKKDLAE